jgi:hypothetical protein
LINDLRQRSRFSWLDRWFDELRRPGSRLHRDRLLCFFFSRFRNRPAALHPEQTALPRQKSGDSLLVLWANTLALMTAKIAKMAMPFAAPIDDSSKSLETTGTI